MKSAATKFSSAEAEVLNVFESWLSAARTCDLEAIVSLYSPDIVAYDAAAQLEFRGIDAYRKHWEMCISMCENPMFEAQAPEIAASGDLAFLHTLLRCGTVDDKGVENASWMRLTVAYRKIGAGSWTSLGTRSDGSVTAAGFLGMAGDEADVRLDNFGGGTVTLSAPTFRPGYSRFPKPKLVRASCSS